MVVGEVRWRIGIYLIFGLFLKTMSSFCLRCLDTTDPDSGVCLEGLVSADLVSILNDIFLSTLGTMLPPPTNIATKKFSVSALGIQFNNRRHHHHHHHHHCQYEYIRRQITFT